MRLTSQWPRAFHALLEGSIYCCTSQGQSRLAQSQSTLAALRSHSQHARHVSSCTATSPSGSWSDGLVVDVPHQCLNCLRLTSSSVTTCFDCRLSDLVGSARSSAPVVCGPKADRAHHLQSPCCMLTGARHPCFGN